jgi:hypothetical protein
VNDYAAQTRNAVGTHTAKLMHHRKTAEYRVIANMHVAGQLSVICEYRVVADLAVVSEMHVSHDPVVASEPRDSRVLRRAAIERAKFANGIGVTYFQGRGLATVFLVLRRLTQRHEVIDAIVASDVGMPGQNTVVPDRRAASDLNMFVDETIGTDTDILRELRARVHDRGRMD